MSIAGTRRALLRTGRPRPLLLATFSHERGAPLDSHGTNHLTKNGPILEVAGKVGNAAQLTAASSTYLSIADNASLSMGDIDFTVGAWVYLDSKPTTGTILAKTVTGSVANNEYILEYLASTDRFRFRVSNGTTQTIVSSTTFGAPSLSTWYFVVGWHDSVGNVIGISVNAGTADTAAHTVGVQDAAAAFALGANSTPAGTLFDGRIDNAFVSKRVLTAQERTDFYNSGNGITYDQLTTAHKVSLVSWWSLDSVQLPALLPTDVGGPLTVTDTLNKMSQSGGMTVIGTGTATGDPGEWGPAVARKVGLALLATFMPVSTPVRQIGFDTNTSGVLVTGIYFVAGGEIRAYDGTAATGNIATYGALVVYQVAVILRNTGSLILIRGGAFVNWTLIWVGILDTGASVFPAHTPPTNAGAAGSTLDDFRTIDLAPLDARFASDYGLCTNRLVSPAAGATTTSTADAVIDFTMPTAPTAGAASIRFRKQDTNNYWQLDIQSSGALTLYERVAGTPTLRANAAASVADGYRYIVVTEGTTIKGYSNNTLRWTYSSASNFQTQTAVEVASLGTGGVMSELICWPRTLSLPGGL